MAAAAMVAGGEEGEPALSAAVPALVLRVTAPGRMVERVGDLFRDELEAMVRTQRSASARPSPIMCTRGSCIAEVGVAPPDPAVKAYKGRR